MVYILIVFVKFLGWIVAIWVRIVRLIREKGGLTTKIKYRIPKKINFGGGGGS